MKLEIIDNAGAWFTLEENRIQGRGGVKQYLIDNPEVCDRIEAQIHENANKLSPNPLQREALAPTGTDSAVSVTSEDLGEG